MKSDGSSRLRSARVRLTDGPVTRAVASLTQMDALSSLRSASVTLTDGPMRTPLDRQQPGSRQTTEPGAILSEGDPSPVSVVRPGGRADLVLLGDHAGNAIPSRLEGLGLGAPDRTRHIAWDIGVRALGEQMAALLDATFVHQPFSRLVIDCNRDPQSLDSILPMSDGTPVPGNVGLDQEAREQRRLAVHAPYHERVAAEIAARRGTGIAAPMVVALHSFTPTYGEERRPWHIGVLHDLGDTRASRAMLTCLRQEADIAVGDNQPYRMDRTDYTVPRHAFANGLPYLELEFRQDLLVDLDSTHRWAIRCVGWIQKVMGRM
jgi:predicted N-formylglutamate amidohydrolase